MSNTFAGRDAININNTQARNITFHTGNHVHIGAASESHAVRKDVFRPSFHVPVNPREVVLDFGDPLNGAEPHTQEAKVLHELLREDCNESGTRVVALHGKGGVGKSCILRALARNERVKERFPDGIYFMSLGMDASMDTVMQGLARITQISGGDVLGNELRGENCFETAVQKVRDWVKGKRCLLLLDDFWERNGLGRKVVEELAQMFSCGRGSVVALTTRFIPVATQGTEIEIEPHDTISERAEAILLRHAKFRREEIEDRKTREVFIKLLEMCGGLPLFLSVIGRAVAELCVELKSKRRLVWKVYWEMVEGQEEGILLETESDEYPDLGKTLRVSLEILCNGRGKQLGSLSMSGYSLSEMHRALCVFKKQTSIPMSVCRRLWNVRSDEVAVRIGKGFADVGLGDIEVEEVGERHVVFMRLHDLVHIFAVKCARNRNEIARWHERLLEGYISRAGSEESVRGWWDVEESSGEEYLFGNICRHLASNGNIKELAELLLSGEWTKFRHRQGGLLAMKQDFSEYLGRRRTVALGEEEEIESGVRMVRDAVVESWAAVHENLHELGFQIFGRLVDCENRFVRKYLESIERVQCGVWIKPTQRLWTRPGEGGMRAEFRLLGGKYDIAVHKDLFIAALAVDKEVIIIDLKEMAVISRCIGHDGLVGCVGISGDGKRVFSISRDHTVRQWDVQSGKEDIEKCIQLDVNEYGGITGAAYCLEKRFIVMGFLGGSVKMWDLCSGERIEGVMRAFKEVECIGVSRNGRTIATWADLEGLQLWDAQTFARLGDNLKGSRDMVRSIEFSPDGRVLAAGSVTGDYCIRLWDVEKKTQIRDIGYRRCSVVRLAFSEDGQQIVSGQDDGWMVVWDVASGAAIRDWRAHFSGVMCVAVVGDGGSGLVVSSDLDSTVRVWDLQAAANVGDVRIQHDRAIFYVAASPDGRFFVSASSDETLRIWSAVDGTALGGPLCGHEGVVTSVAVSPDSQRLVSGSNDRTVRVWEVGSCAQVGDALRGHEAWVTCVAYSGDGRFVVSGSDDCTARVWRVKYYAVVDESTGERANKCVRIAEPGMREMLSSWEPFHLEKVLEHKMPSGERDWKSGVRSVAMSRNGERVLSGLWNGEIWVWDVSSGECIYRTQSENDIPVVRIEISENYEVVTMNERYEELWWQLDEGGGLAQVLEIEDGTGVAHAEPQEGSVSDSLNEILCGGYTVWLGGSGENIGTVPDRVPVCTSWKYDAERKILCTGLSDGRVLVFRVEL